MRSVSKGLQNLASATVTDMSLLFIIFAACRHCWTIEPYPKRATLHPSNSILPFPIYSIFEKLKTVNLFVCYVSSLLYVKWLIKLTSRGVPLLLNGITAPIPLPLGNLKQLGLSSMTAAVVTMCISSASSDGAMTTILGKQAMYVISNAPQWVAPSAPTKPAQSIAKRTGSFWRSTSCTTFIPIVKY